MLTPTQIAMLDAQLDPRHIKKPTGSFGPKGDYLEGWHVINEMNRVFGFDGWSYTIALTRDAVEQVEVTKQGKPPEQQWQAAYTCVCTLTVGETTRQDVGFGSGFARGIGDAIEGATKEAATDALKRCARTFGNIFGLALYDKSRAGVGVTVPPIVETMLAEIKACDTVADLLVWRKANGKKADGTGFGELLAGEWGVRKEGLDQVAALGAG